MTGSGMAATLHVNDQTGLLPIVQEIVTTSPIPFAAFVILHNHIAHRNTQWHLHCDLISIYKRLHCNFSSHG